MLVSYKRFSNRQLARATTRVPEDELYCFACLLGAVASLQSERPPPHAPLASEAASLRPAPAAA